MNYEIKNAIIKKVSLFIEEHGLLTAFLQLKYSECSEQGFGGYMLFGKHKVNEQGNYAGLFVYRCLQVFDQSEWKSLQGLPCRAATDGGLVRGIGHIIEDRWFYPGEEMKALEAKTYEWPKS